MTTLRRIDPKARTLAPVRPSAVLAIKYQKRIDALLAEMNTSIQYWIKAAYKANEPAILAQDELPAAALKRAMRDLARRWQKRFDEMAPALAEYFAQAAHKRSDTALRMILRRGGISVKFTMSRAQKDILAATVAQNVALIRSIPQQYLSAVEGSVMRSVQTGRDLHQLSEDLQNHFGVTKRKAAFIARDQNNRATSMLQRARQIEIGIKEAVWLHSGGGKEPRPNHVRFGREKARYDVAKGMWDPDANGKNKGAWILPGELVNCRCVCKPVVEGFS